MKKSFAELRSNMIADIDAIRLGQITTATGAVLFQGYKEITSNINAEIAAAKLSLLTEGKVHSFGKVARMGRRVINDDADGEGEAA